MARSVVITINPAGVMLVARSPQMQRYLGLVAKAAAAEVERRIPHRNVIGPITVRFDTRQGARSAEGIVEVKGHGWHLYEHGSEQNAAEPYIRPGIQAALVPFGGHYGAGV